MSEGPALAASRAERFRELTERVPGLSLLARRLRASRRENLSAEQLYRPGASSLRGQLSLHAALRSTLLAALRGSPRACAEAAGSLLNEIPGLVRDPSFAERYLLELAGEGHGFAASNLGWAYEQNVIEEGLEPKRRRDLQAACFVLAEALGEERIRTPLARLREEGAVPDAETAWQLLRARALELEAQPLAPVWRRSPPRPLPELELRLLAWELVGELSSRSPFLLSLHQRALSAGIERDRAAEAFRGALSGDLLRMARLGEHMACETGGEPGDRACGRLLLLAAAEGGRSQALDPLARAFVLDGREREAAACRIAQPLLARAASAQVPLPGSAPETEAWETIWRASEADRAALGLEGEVSGAPSEEPFPLHAPVGERADLPLARERWLTAWRRLLRRAPTARFLAREATLAGYAQLDADAFGAFETLARRQSPVEFAAASLAREPSLLGFALMEIGRDEGSVFSDRISALALYAAASGFSKRSYFGLFRHFEARRESALLRAALTFAIEAKEPEAILYARAATHEVTAGLSPSQALEILRGDLAARWRASPSGWAEALEPSHPPPLPLDELARRVSHFARGLLIRHPGLAQEYAEVPLDLRGVALHDEVRAADQRREGSGAAFLIRSLVLAGDPSELGHLSQSLSKQAEQDPTLMVLAWACLHRQAELARSTAAWSVLAAAYARFGYRELGACALTLAEGQGSGVAEANLTLRDAPKPPRAEALARIRADRDRAYMAAGYPWVR